MKMSGISSECVKRTVADLNGEKELAFVMVTGDLLLDGEVENAQEIKKISGSTDRTLLCPVRQS